MARFEIGQEVQHRLGAGWSNASNYGVRAVVISVVPEEGAYEVRFHATGNRYWFNATDLRHYGANLRGYTTRGREAYEAGAERAPWADEVVGKHAHNAYRAGDDIAAHDIMQAFAEGFQGAADRAAAAVLMEV